MNFLITAGPTREYIDPIRFISNSSSGKMGMAIAESAKKRGHNVVLIMGYCTVQPPREIPMVMTITAEEMREAVFQYIDWADVLVMSAAVGDWKVRNKSKDKIKKEGKTLTLNLTNNPDILAEIGKLKKQGKTKKGLFLVGFSVDSKCLIENAERKLKKKRLDLIVANPLDTFGRATVGAAIIDKQGKVADLPLLSKKRFAGKLVRMIEKRIHL